MNTDYNKMVFDEKGETCEPPAPKFDGDYVVAETGAKRSNRAGKGRYDLIPSRPLERVALVYEAGAKVHGDWNWANGIKMSRTLDSAERHIRQYLDGDRSEDHLAQAVWNLCAAMYFEEHMPEMNDLRKQKSLRSEPSNLVKNILAQHGIDHSKVYDVDKDRSFLREMMS